VLLAYFGISNKLSGEAKTCSAKEIPHLKVH